MPGSTGLFSLINVIYFHRGYREPDGLTGKVPWEYYPKIL